MRYLTEEQVVEFVALYHFSHNSVTKYIINAASV